MVGPFQKLNEFLDFVEALPRRSLQVPRLNFEGFPGRLLGGQAEAQEMIDHLLERTSRAPVFFLDQLGDIVIKSKRGSHIMMLHY
jgi:hypothetical protein